MSKNKSRAGIALIIVLVLVLLGIGAYVGYTYVQSDVNGNRNTKTEYNLVIEKDDFAYQIGEKLKSNGVIKNDTLWNWWMDKHYPKFSYINGEYRIPIYLIKAFLFVFLRDILFLILPRLWRKTISVKSPIFSMPAKIRMTMIANF